MDHKDHLAYVAGLLKIDVKELRTAVLFILTQDDKFAGSFPALAVCDGHVDLGLAVITGIIGSQVGLIHNFFHIDIFC
ncbi:hypothetical protein H206_06297 [Candidatus Electrothrix aarhusensis]|uniref:Uncharacterized protein n=1 Tax=Candidatus Electrothrix aarhusensis TaxID=1859131 RepID=A0A3S3R9N8_9BACT|nr:hypothetical protein H206_06297 [Candidatus Electrothrix aarhusensis]